jgi:hypothetical protein
MRIGIKTSAVTSKSIDWAANTSRSAVEDMGIDHRRFNIIMPQKFLHRSYIVPALEQVSRKRMPECVASRRISYKSSADGKEYFESYQMKIHSASCRPLYRNGVGRGLSNRGLPSLVTINDSILSCRQGGGRFKVTQI